MITESATINNSDISSLIEQFHEAGFTLLLDDFGSGYSSLSSLNVMHFDTIKLDKSLIDYIGDRNGEKLLLHITQLLQSFGMTFRKAEYITDIARKIESGEFDLEGIRQRPDDEAIRELSGLKGVGVWTAEMILLFCMQRPDVFSYDDLAIQRGLRMVYHHRKIDRKLFEKYRRRFSPYCSVASLYLWAAAGGAVPGLKDYAPAQKPKRKG